MNENHRIVNQDPKEVPVPPYYGGAERGIAVADEFDMVRFLYILREKWITIASVFILSILSAKLYLEVAQKIYEASSLVELAIRRPSIAGQQGALIDDSYHTLQSEEIFNSWLERFKSRTMFELAMQQLKSSEDFSQWSGSELQRLLKRSNIVLIRRSRLVRLSVNNEDPRLSAAAANALADAAIGMALEENKAASESAVKWLESQAQSQRKELEKADKELSEFRTQNQIGVLESEKKSVEESLLGFNRALVEVESQRVLARELVTALSRLELKPENAGQLPASVPRAVEIQNMLEKWLAAISDRDALLAKYKEKHPAVVAQNKVVDVLRGQAMDSIRRARATSESNLKLFEQQAESLSQKMSDLQKQASRLETQIIDLQSKASTLDRAREASDISYKSILKRIEEARLSADENTATVKILERAAVPEQPVRPRKKIVLFSFLMLGLLGGVGLALLTDMLGDAISSPADIEKGVGLAILALVPHVRRVDRQSLTTSCMTSHLGQLTEAFAGVRSALDSSKNKGISHIVLISSAAPADGKTVTACNLAIMCAKSGIRTLLVDFDMRRPTMYKIFNMPQDHASLIHELYAHDVSAFSRLPFKTTCPGLDVIGGRYSKDISPAEIMGRRIVRDFFLWAANHYERVIIDAPPFSVVSDPMVLADLVGCVILVCRLNRSRKRAVCHTVKRLRETGALVIGAIVNDVDFRKGLYALDDGKYHGYYNYDKYMEDVS